MISFTSVLEARAKIRYGKTRNISMQYALDCNPLNEGCKGGWPILGGYFFEHFSIPLASCAKYQASTANTKCSDWQDCNMALQVEKTYYLGGYYGNANEINMMKEIRSRGPIIGDLEVPLSFSYYTSGVFSDDHSKAMSSLQKFNENTSQFADPNFINKDTFKDYHI